ncbi:cupin domain-containing protein [Amycolatopsis pigmentata]|uniref:Cupin domain-containing protein n=1 Tax=Amycolatopsis pigmentata TaxID=450801 RepID=A0ABW5FRI1_9PSEU
MHRFARKVFGVASTTAALVGLTAALVPVTAEATPGVGVSAVTIFDKTVGNTEYVLKEITLAPGGSTGWHYHPGQVRGFVKQGTLTHNDSDCSIDGVYRRGQAISEASGPGYVHLGRNLGTTPVVLEVLYQNSVGTPLAVDMPNPGCSFQ